MEDKLKPCPFCGSSDIDPEGVLASKDGGENYSYPACNDCSASCEDWNNRTPTKQSTPEEVREAVKTVQQFISITSDSLTNHAEIQAIETLIHHATRADGGEQASKSVEVTDEQRHVLLEDMRCKVVYSDKVTMPIPLYERIKSAFQSPAVPREFEDKLTQLLNEARCLSKRVVGNRELAQRIIALLGGKEG